MGVRRTANADEQRLTHLRNGLLRLHKVLLESERAVYERDVKKIKSPWEMLDLVMHDPWFAWLRELSTLVVEIDERLEGEEPMSSPDAERLLALARGLLSPAEDGTGFPKHYYQALQRDPDVVIGHSEMMKVLTALE